MSNNSGFFYDGDDDVEKLDMYKPGGYHPVLLGDVLPKNSATREPRYRVMHKLGHGAFATIWMARDLRGDFGYVAVKINASRITGRNNEIGILRWLSEVKQDHHAGDRNIIHLLDEFVDQGPNGTHECLIMEVVAGMSDFRYTLDFQARAKEISFQTLLGLSCLHERGVAHGDLHLGNLAISLPQLNEHSEEEIMDFFANPQIVAVIARNPKEQTNSLPAYLVPSVSMVDYYSHGGGRVVVEPLCVKIMDFGNSFREEDKRPASNTPISIRAPEVTFCELSRGEVGSDWNHHADIWAAACTLFELNFGYVMLYGMGRGDSIIYHTFQVAGLPPPAWLQYWDMDKFCTEHGETTAIDPEVFWTTRRRHQLISLNKKYPDSKLQHEQDTDLLIDLLRKMLRVVPEERPGMKELLGHPWFSELCP